MSRLVLLVDDSLTVRMDIAEALEEAGFEVAGCESLTEARRALESTTFDLAILDVMLPDGDGVDLLETIRSRPETASLPVIVLSTRAEVQDRIHGMARGADEYVGKPYDTVYLVSRAHQLIRRARGHIIRQEETPLSILVVDDSPTFRAEIGITLGEAGYEVGFASSAEHGLRLAETLRPDGLIVDMGLPSMSGTQLIQRVRQDPVLRGLPCLLLTASESAEDEISGLEAGADDYVRKSADPTEVLARLKAMLRWLPSPSAVSREAGLFSAKKVLAVDDSLTFLEEVGEELRSIGYDVAYARSGEEALQLLEVESFDCVLLDLIMDGISGQETCRRIKNDPSLRQTPVIVLTSQEDRRAMIESMDAGADDYIAKSADFDVLRARLRAQLRRRHYELENRRISEELSRKEIEAEKARAAQKLAETRASLLAEVEEKNLELEKANEELRLANKELDSFTYSVSHDLRAPLRALSGFSQILAEEHRTSLGDEALELVERIDSAARRMTHIVDALLGLSRLSRAPLNKTRTDLSTICDAIFDDLRQSDEAHEVDVSIQRPMVAFADPKLVRVLLENLLRNAWKFTRDIADPRIEITVEHSSRRSVFAVRDNGAGFDMAHSDRLFAPFQRLHSSKEYEGTGVGLATVRRIVNRHGGRIWADSQLGEGACFYFTLESERRRTGERKHVQ